MENFKEMYKVGDSVKLQKISDDKFNGRHPNGVVARHTVYGKIVRDFDIESSLFLTDVTGDSYGFFYTSRISEFVNENTFKTANSTYHIEKYEKQCDRLAEIIAGDFYLEIDNMSKT